MPLKIKLADLAEFLKMEAKINEYVSSPIISGKEILTLKGNPFIFPRTINVIQGKYGSHKSRLTEHICSILLKRPNHEIDLLKLESIDSKHLVCYIDTERNIPEQFSHSLQQIKIKAGYDIEDKLENFRYNSLLKIKRQERSYYFESYLEKIRNSYQGHIFCVLDVLTDFIKNFNDPNGSLELIDLLNNAINSYDITFLCVIHENPFGDKARGHLGTELLNKCSTALSINFENENSRNERPIIKIKFLKARESKRMEPLYIKYSPDLNHLVYVEPSEVEKVLSSKVIKAPIHEVAFYIIKYFYKC